MYCFSRYKDRHKNKYTYMKHFQGSRTTTSNSRIPAIEHTYLPGGALLTPFNQYKGRVIDTGSDTVGRWAWQRLIGKGNKIIHIISTYMVSQTSMSGDTKAYAQQHQMLTDLNHTNPLPKQ